MADTQEEHEQFSSNLLNCSICYQVFTEPKVLPCLHIFCFACISRHFIMSKEKKREKLHCPKCRLTVPLPIYAVGVESLQDDRSIERIKELFVEIGIKLYSDNDPILLEKTNNLNNNAKANHRQFRKHIKLKEEMKEMVSNIKKHVSPLSSKLSSLCNSNHYARINWKKELKLLQKVLIPDPDLPDVAENREILERNKLKEDIADQYNPVIEWIETSQNIIFNKVSEIKAVSDVAKDVLRNASYDQLIKCADRLKEKLIETAAYADSEVPLPDKPINYDKLTEKNDLILNTRLTHNAEDATEALSELNREITAPLSKLSPENDEHYPDPRKITWKIVAKIMGKGSGPGQFNSPASVSFAPNGDIMVSDRNNFRLQIFEADGTYKGELFKGRIKPNRVCINPVNSTFYVDDDSSKLLKVFSAEGLQLTGKEGGAGWSKDMDFHGFDSEGNIVMSHPIKCSICIHNKDDGELIHSFFFNNFEEEETVNNPHCVALSNDDYIVISESKANHVQVFTHQGHYLYLIPHLMVPRGVCVDHYGNIFVAEGDAHRISVYNRYGKLVKYLLTERDGIKYPMSLAINKEGLLVITQYGLYLPHQVLIVQLNYKKETII